MLQRAASNAYSWWWASHIRTKQSKWLEQSLQDMEEKVTQVLKLIEEDGDSFAKRAEMYYKKRPELIHFVEESYRAFRALAERYDLMSKELQNANSTLASAFPDQYQFEMEEDDEDDNRSPKLPKRSTGNIPSVPKHFPTRKIKAMMALTSKTGNNILPSRNVPGRSRPAKTPESGLTKAQAVEEIDMLQKAILTKQTEKEFTKSSYETGVAKYWEIEQEITEMQERVSKLQDEFGVGKDIEDNEARTLMLGAALKSCQDTLAQLQEKQERSAVEAREERQKIMDARHKLLSFKGEVLGSGEGEGEPNWMALDVVEDPSSSKAKELEMLRDKIKEHFEVESPLSVSEMADKIDELVGQVINLETAVSSQTAIIQRLRVETDELQQHVQNLEHDKANLIDGKNTLSDKVKEMEDKLRRLQELEQSVQSTNTHLQMQFTDATCNLDEISLKLPTVKLDQGNEQQMEPEKSSVFIAVPGVSASPEESAKQHDFYQEAQGEQDASQSIPRQREPQIPSKELQGPEILEEPMDSTPASVAGGELRDSSPAAIVELLVTQSEVESRKDQAGEATDAQIAQPEEKAEDEPNWQQLFMSGLEGKEKVILNEYTSILRNYKDVKKRLCEVENKSENSLTELRELEVENANKDNEIQSLRQKLILLQQKLEEHKNMKESKEDPSLERDDDIIHLIVEEPRMISPVEEKLRANIDEILEENLDFWMRFSSSFSQVQKLQSEIEDLQKELAKIENEKKKSKKEGSSTPDRSLKSDARPIYKHLKQIQTELTVWLEKSGELKDELKCRFSQLCRILEDITRALSDGAVDEEMKFTSYQAAKFQGEVLNMQQENKKVEDELQAAVDHVSSLQTEVERTITRLNEELGIPGSKSSSQMREGGNRNRIPLGAFIFGSKTKKHKQSILSSMHPSWHKKH